MPGFSDLSRELIDHIISDLISLYDNDPAYQWTCLRKITRYHKTMIERHFRHFWVPELSLTIRLSTPDDYDVVCFEAPEEDCPDAESSHKELRQDGSGKYVTFVADDYDEDVLFDLYDNVQDWLDEVVKAAHRVRHDTEHAKSIVVRMGDGILNKGFTKGGIVSDVLIPGVAFNIQTDPWQLSFDWKALFGLLFGEEMAMRRFADRLLAKYMPRISVLRLRKTPAAVYTVLREHYHWKRREMLLAYRKHIESQKLLPDGQPFDLTPFLPDQAEPPSFPKISDHDSFVLCLDEQSVVFKIPQWELLTIRQVARLRIMDELIELDMMPEQGMSRWGRHYYEEMQVREDEMMGHRKASEEKLKQHLRGPTLNSARFWD